MLALLEKKDHVSILLMLDRVIGSLIWICKQVNKKHDEKELHENILK